MQAFASCGEQGLHPRCSEGFSLWHLLLLRSTGSTRTGFRSCSLWSLKYLGCTGLAVLQHVESSQTRDQTHVPCIGRQIPNHWTTREAPDVLNRSLGHKEVLRPEPVGVTAWTKAPPSTRGHLPLSRLSHVSASHPGLPWPPGYSYSPQPRVHLVPNQWLAAPRRLCPPSIPALLAFLSTSYVHAGPKLLQYHQLCTHWS